MANHTDLPEREPEGVQAIRDRILVHTLTVEAAEPANESTSGVIISTDAAAGSQRSKDAKRRLRGPVLLDRSYYEGYTASTTETFYERAQNTGQQMLLPPPSRHSYPGADQLGNGATAVLTPTRHFTTRNPAAVTVATRLIQRLDLDPGQVIFTVPLSADWLRTDRDTAFLIQTLNAVPHIKALVIGSATNDPLRDRPAAQRLRRLIEEIHDAALIRTDLAGLDAYAHGAVFVSIGLQHSRRVYWPPDARHPKANPGGKAKLRVLHPDLLEYFDGGTLAHLYGRTEQPACPCAFCNGESYTRFVSDFEDEDNDVSSAEQHNLATWLPWAEELQAASVGHQRQQLWQRRCEHALDARGPIETQWDSQMAPKIGAGLSLWAQPED